MWKITLLLAVLDAFLAISEDLNFKCFWEASPGPLTDLLKLARSYCPNPPLENVLMDGIVMPWGLGLGLNGTP